MHNEENIWNVTTSSSYREQSWRCCVLPLLSGGWRVAGLAGLRLGGVEEGLAEHTVTCFMPNPPLLLPGHKAGDAHPCWAKPQGTPTPAKLGSRGNQPLLGQAGRDEFIFGVGDRQGQVALSTWPGEQLISSRCTAPLAACWWQLLYAFMY